MKRGRTTRELIRDYAIYLAVGLALVSTVLWGAAHNVDAKWLMLPWWTLLIFGFIVGTYRGWIGTRRFWIPLTGLLAMHLIAYTVAFMHAYQLQARWAMVLFLAEIAAIDAVLGYFGVRPRRRVAR